jgi:hypothetical protein
LSAPVVGLLDMLTLAMVMIMIMMARAAQVHLAQVQFEVFSRLKFQHRREAASAALFV